MARKRSPGFWYPWIFVGGMLVVIAVNAVLASYAVETFPGLETENAYKKGLAYNETIAASRAQDERGWQANVKFAPANGSDAHAGSLLVEFADRNGTPLHGLSVSAQLIRPTHGGGDFTVSLVEQDGGLYATTMAFPLPGQWDAWVRADSRSGKFQITRRILVP